MLPSRTHLSSRFEHAGLTLELSGGPLAVTGNDAIVQLDIARGKRVQDEHFRLWPGHGSNRIEVEGVDRPLNQLVLMVHEPRRRFEVALPKAAADRNPGLTVVREDKRRVWVERFTDDRKRHFLCGLDEQHAFIAQLSDAVSTVRQAHGSLRPAGLLDAEARARASAIRQGEFFFVPLCDADLKRVMQLGKNVRVRQKTGIAQAAQWTRAGREHLADEVWSIRASATEHYVLVRGEVRHPDHRSLRLSHWMRVFQNRETAETRPAGVLWVD